MEKIAGLTLLVSAGMVLNSFSALVKPGDDLQAVLNRGEDLELQKFRINRWLGISDAIIRENKGMPQVLSLYEEALIRMEK